MLCIVCHLKWWEVNGTWSYNDSSTTESVEIGETAESTESITLTDEHPDIHTENASGTTTSSMTESIWIIVAAVSMMIPVIGLVIWRVIQFQKKQTTLTIIEMGDQVNSNSAVSPSAATSTPKGVLSEMPEIEGIDERYSRIIVILRECDIDRWEDYLENFKREMVTDKALEFMNCDPKDDEQQIWKELLPQFGVRVIFKTLWNERHGLGHDRNVTTGGLFVVENAHHDDVENDDIDVGDEDAYDRTASELFRVDTNQEEEGADTNLRRTTPAGSDGNV